MAHSAIAFLGPQGAAAEAAAIRYFGSGSQRCAYASLDAVHAAVAGGACAYGVLPLESSVDGPINRSHDLLFAGAVKVVGQVLQPCPADSRTGLNDACVRYGVIAGPAHPPHVDDDHLMVAVSLPQRPGSLLELLSPLARRRLSVEHWCTRPARVEGWHYRFHFTISAPPDSEDVRQALQDAAAFASELKVLGRYRSKSRI